MQKQTAKDRLKVLMLGWEFPPVMSGGLGVACYGLSQMLKKYVDLTMVVPKTDPQFLLDNMSLIGLNNEVTTIDQLSKYQYSKQEENRRWTIFDVEIS